MDENMDLNLDETMDKHQNNTWGRTVKKNLAKGKTMDNNVDKQQNVDWQEYRSGRYRREAREDNRENRAIRTANLNIISQSSLKLSIYRKSTHSHKYLHFRSCNPLSLKRNVYRGLSL